MITIGTAKDNDIVIDDNHVSQHHAKLYQNEKGEWMMEDTGSTNGTFIDGQQIIKKKVLASNRIQFGDRYFTALDQLLKEGDDYSEQFNALKKVYDDYIKEKIKIQSSNQFKTRLFQSIPFALTGIMGIAIGILGKSDPVILAIGLCITICAPTLGIYLGARQSAKIPAQLQMLSNRFKIAYVCPKCGVFLGEIPWESLRNRKRCPVSTCGAKWVRDKK